MNIRNIKTVFFRELSAYFNSPIAYIFIIVFVLLSAGLFMSNFFLINAADMRYFFALMPYMLCIFMPAISMRLWAEERKGSTYELLLTFPMRSIELVLGKFAAGKMFFLLALGATLFVPFVLILSGKPDIGPMFGGYVGVALIGIFFLSIGMFVSSLCREQIVAFVVSMICCFVFYLIGVDFMATIIDGWAAGWGTFLRQFFGVARHVASFEKGVIDFRDVLYFVLMTGLFLLLNVFAIEDRLKPKARLMLGGAVLLCLAAGVLFNMLLIDTPLPRLDLTEGRIYTVGQTTKKIISGLPTPVQATLYISPPERMPTAFKTLEQDIRDRLDELRVVSQGKFMYSVIHLETTPSGPDLPDQDTQQERLQQKGIQPFQVQSIEKDEMGVKLIYSSLALAFKEREEQIIPTVVTQTLPNLEYEIVSRIFRMTLAQRPRVALIAPYEDKQVDPQLRALMMQLGQQVGPQFRQDNFSGVEGLLRYEEYDVRRIRLSQTEPLSDDITTAIVIAPEQLDQRQRYELSRFLSQGGRVIVAAQQYDYDYRAAGRGGVEISPRPRPAASAVNEWLQPYGLRISDLLLMDEQHTVLSIAGGMAAGPFSLSIPVKAPNQILLNQEQMNADISITNRLSSLLYLWGSALEVSEATLQEKGLAATVLLHSSPKSWQVAYQGQPLAPADSVAPAATASYPLAVMVQGSFPFTYEAKPPPWNDQAPAAEAAENMPEVNIKPGTLVVIGCSTMFEDDFIRNGGMASLMLNTVDVLTLGGELISIRGQQVIDRSLRALSSGQKAWYRFLSMVAAPLLVALLGIARAMARRREKTRYLAALSGV